MRKVGFVNMMGPTDSTVLIAGECGSANIVGGITGFIALALILHQPALILTGLTPLAFWAGISVWNYRRGPALLDNDGVTRRDGVRFAWKEPGRTKAGQHGAAHGQQGGLNHMVLRFREGGVVTIFPLVIEEPYKILESG